MEFSPQDSPFEMEEKIEVKVDPCLLCGEPAVTYDLEGNVIKSEFCDGEQGKGQTGKRDKEQLLQFLCKTIGVNKETRKNGVNPWGLQLEPFPFCKTCETLLLSLAEVYSKLDELKNELRKKIGGGEAVYQKDNLYDKLDNAYLEFRKDALLEIGMIQIGPKLSAALPSRPTRLKRTKPKETKTRAIKTGRVKVQQRSKGKTQVIPELPLPQVSKDTKHEDDETALPPRQLRNRSSQQSYHEEYSSNDEMNPPTPSQITPDSDSNSLDEQPKPTRKIERKNPPKLRTHKSKIISKCKNTAPVKVAKNRRVELQKSTYSGPNAGFLERDAATGNITYSTGYGNRFGSNRTVLLFKHQETPDGKMEYECSECQETFPVLTGTKKQQQIFRAHYLVAHTDRYNCRLCAASSHPVSLSNREQLLQHLSSYHSIYTMEKYNSASNYYKRGTPVRKVNSRSPRERAGLQKACSICGMPWPDLRSSEFRNHLFSHMNEEEKLEALRLQGRRHKELLAPTQQQLENDSSLSFCQSCGRFITKGELGLKRHQLEFHPDLVDPADKSNVKNLCSICAATLCNKGSLETHMKNQHPNGKWDGPLKCKFPGCSHNSTGEPNLKVHVEEEHGQSEEARKGVLCMTCGKVLASAWTLKVHGTVHSGAKPWNCSICPKSFPLKSTLELHLVTKHGIGVEMFKCEVEGCGKLFPLRRYHRYHMRKFHGVFTKNCKGQREATGEAQE